MLLEAQTLTKLHLTDVFHTVLFKGLLQQQ